MRKSSGFVVLMLLVCLSSYAFHVTWIYCICDVSHRLNFHEKALLDLREGLLGAVILWDYLKEYLSSRALGAVVIDLVFDFFACFSDLGLKF